MGGDERRCSITDEALERVAGHHDGLSYEPGEPLFAFVVEHECVHHVLGDLVDTDEQTVLLAADEDRFAVDAQHPTPSGGLSSVETSRGVLAAAPNSSTQRLIAYRETGRPTLPSNNVANVRYDALPLHVDADRLEHNVVGEASPPPCGPPFQGEARAAGRTKEALKRPERAAQTTRTRTCCSVPLRLVSNDPHAGQRTRRFEPPERLLSGRLPDGYYRSGR